MEHIKDCVNVPGWYLLWVLKKEKTDVCVRALNPQARLQAAHWEKNNSVQTITFISHTHTQTNTHTHTHTHSELPVSLLLRTRGKVKINS